MLACGRQIYGDAQFQEAFWLPLQNQNCSAIWQWSNIFSRSALLPCSCNASNWVWYAHPPLKACSLSSKHVALSSFDGGLSFFKAIYPVTQPSCLQDFMLLLQKEGGICRVVSLFPNAYHIRVNLALSVTASTFLPGLLVLYKSTGFHWKNFYMLQCCSNWISGSSAYDRIVWFPAILQRNKLRFCKSAEF